MSDIKQCDGRVVDRSSRMGRTHQCSRKASVERNGNHWCGIHDPEVRNAKQAVRDAAWREKFDAERKVRLMERAAPALYEALDALMRAQWQVCIDYGSDAKYDALKSTAEAALRAARGE